MIIAIGTLVTGNASSRCPSQHVSLLRVSLMCKTKHDHAVTAKFQKKFSLSTESRRRKCRAQLAEHHGRVGMASEQRKGTTCHVPRWGCQLQEKCMLKLVDDKVR